jgi:hypothetical protein
MLEAAARSGGTHKTGKKGPKLLPEGAIVLTRQHTEAAPQVPQMCHDMRAHWCAEMLHD